VGNTMKYKITDSINRAKVEVNSPSGIPSLLIIKIEPNSGECCCLNHWHSAWEEINKYISPNTPMEVGLNNNEPDTLIKTSDYFYVLECHESGPEIVIPIGLFVVTLQLAKSISDLILFIIKLRHQDEPNNVYTIRSYDINGNLVKECELKSNLL